jgi:hypothetical protein
VLEEVSVDDDTDRDPDRDTAYYMRERDRLICRGRAGHTPQSLTTRGLEASGYR